MIRFFRLLLTALALFMPLFALPAAAAPAMVMSTADKIELVRDLPNDQTFEHDGQYYDLGYLYSTERVNGADVARSGAGFVLYHDDRFIRLDAEKLAMISDVLGEDPTAGYVPPAKASTGTPYSPSSAYSAGSSSSSDGTPYRPATRSRSGGLGWLIIFPVILFLSLLRWARNAMIRGLVEMIFGSRRRNARRATSDPVDPFEDRVAARLAELNAAPGGSAAVPQGYQPQPASMAPVSRGFGRKGI